MMSLVLQILMRQQQPYSLLLISFFLLLQPFFYSSSAHAQVRIVQWTDTHSTLSTKSQQLAAIDQQGKEFLRLHPRGEFVVYVIGDFTSINPYSQMDGGQLSFEALRVLKSKGYTVLFTPGNHDAFDWTGKVDGSELFLQ